MAEYIIQGETLTNIANAIRSKTGNSGAITPGDMATQIANIQGSGIDIDNIPEDIIKEAERVINNMRLKMGSNSLTFIAMSDSHEPGPNELLYDSEAMTEQIIRGNINAGQAARLISQKLPIDFFVHLGDLAWGAASTSANDGISSIRKVREYIAEVVLNNESFITPGNHDNLTDGSTVAGDYLNYNMLTGLIGTYQYKDFDDKKIRVICLNTADNSIESTKKEWVSGEQLQWFCKSLDLSEKRNAAEWGIIILSHHPLDWNSNIKPAGDAVAAYLSGKSYELTRDGVSINYDFNGKNKAKIIAQFHGHLHNFKVDYIHDLRTGSPIPTTAQRIAIPNTCFYRNNTYGSNGSTEYYGIEFGEAESYDKIDNNTGKNTSFCLVSIDLDKKVIYADCFGAGYDRIIGYAGNEPVTYKITNTLSNATTDNTNSNILEEKKYTAKITANDNYKILSIIVIMGGEDITDTAVNGNIINIPSVTGDIEIIVETISSIPYTVSYELTKVSSENKITEVIPGTSYSTMLIAEDGYDINFVRVFVGGEDITNKVYSDGKISISSVNGDIKIIAGYYTNLVPTSTILDDTKIYNDVGYKDGYRISGGINESKMAGHTITGVMPYASDTDGVYPTIYIKGCTLDITDSSCRWTGISLNSKTGKMQGTEQLSGNAKDEANQFATHFTIDTLGTDYYRLTPIAGSIQANVAYMMMSLEGSGVNLIVTNNQPILDMNYTITNDLINVENSNNITEVSSTSSYMATLTPITGYSIGFYRVLMGNTDITGTACIEDNDTININIEKIDGDIHIIAGNYNNLITTSTEMDGKTIYNEIGYKNDTYISNAGTYKDSAGIVATGYIKATSGTKVYIKGAEISTNDKVRIYTYESISKSGVSNLYLSGGGTADFETGIWSDASVNKNTVVQDLLELGENYYSFTFPKFGVDEFWYRMSLEGTGEKLVITHGQEISRSL